MLIKNKNVLNKTLDWIISMDNGVIMLPTVYLHQQLKHGKVEVSYEKCKSTTKIKKLLYS